MLPQLHASGDLPRSPQLIISSHLGFVVIRSGQQGITAATAAATIPPEVKVVLNWFEELKKIAPPQAK